MKTFFLRKDGIPDCSSSVSPSLNACAVISPIFSSELQAWHFNHVPLVCVFVENFVSVIVSWTQFPFAEDKFIPFAIIVEPQSRQCNAFFANVGISLCVDLLRDSPSWFCSIWLSGMLPPNENL